MKSPELQYKQQLIKWYAGETKQEPQPPAYLRDYVIANIKDYAKRLAASLNCAV